MVVGPSGCLSAVRPSDLALERGILRGGSAEIGIASGCQVSALARADCGPRWTYARYVITVRPADVTDVAALRVVASAAYDRYVRRIGRAPAPMTADYTRTVRSGHAWVAVEHGEVVGLVVLVAQRDHLLLENVAVLPAAQGRGIGARLMTLAEDLARGLHLSEIRLYTNEAMTENLSYYPRHGYFETHRAEQDGFQRVFFRKRLID